MLFCVLDSGMRIACLFVLRMPCGRRGSLVCTPPIGSICQVVLSFWERILASVCVVENDILRSVLLKMLVMYEVSLPV